jgi:hypothetical protein
MTNKTFHQVSFTATETVSLPSDDPLVMGIRSRDWTKLRKTVEALSNETNTWELVFTVSTTVFFSFLLPALTTSGKLAGWKLIFEAISLASFCVALTSLIAMRSAKKRYETERSDVIELMNDIQSLYGDVATFDTEQARGKALPSKPNQPEYDEEELYEDAKRVAYDLGKVSTSLLQRKLRIGYGRAARIVDKMEREGIASPSDGARPRSVFINQNDITQK